MDSAEKTKRVPSGRVMTVAEYFEANPQSIHTINNDPARKGVIFNGTMIEIGSVEWYNMAGTKLYWDTLLGEIRFLYDTNGRYTA